MNSDTKLTLTRLATGVPGLDTVLGGDSGRGMRV